VGRKRGLAGSARRRLVLLDFLFLLPFLFPLVLELPAALHAVSFRGTVRTGTSADDLLGDAAQEQPLEPCVSPRAHDDDVRPRRPREALALDRLVRPALDDVGIGARVLRRGQCLFEGRLRQATVSLRDRSMVNGWGIALWSRLFCSVLFK
jgi:hypothetical protein